MYIVQLYVAILGFLLFTPVYSSVQSCSVAPFAVQLKNCTFASGTVSWGNLIEIGSPPQRVCLVPSTVVNSTLVSQKSLCAKSNTLANNQCESLRGGFFNENSSTTWTESTIAGYNDSRSNPTWDHFNPPGLTKVGFETLKFPGSTDVTLSGAGIALNQFGNNSNAGMIGLGKNSVFLEDAVHQNKSPSRSWSLDSGSSSLVKPRNGELVIGGYNQGRLDGSFRWSRISDMSGERPCPLRTVIKDMSVLLPNGSTYPLKSSAEDISACIEPYDNLFRFTPGMLFNWKHITGFDEKLMGIYTNPTSQSLSFTELGLPYAEQNTQEWSLTITLDNGYTTTLPHYEMQKPLLGWNVIGEKERVPGVANIAILNAPTSKGEVPTLGKVFLSRSYLAVDYPTNRFGLAEVLVEPGASQLVTLGCGTDQNATSPDTSLPSSKTPVGAIVGGVLGGVAIVILAAAFFCFRRRKSRRNNDSPLPPPAPMYNNDHVKHEEMDASEPLSPPQYHASMSGAGLSPKSGHIWVDAQGIQRHPQSQIFEAP